MEKEELKKKRESFGLPAYFRAKRGIKVPAQNLLGEARPLRGRLPQAGSYLRVKENERIKN
ncbi:MAG: hypothetical protein COT34_01635 [Candidatus Nealsonbacteria bacterium CG08_land_8_20_14_0_20_43_11]|uniref:Uncharacterized protein n=1 Tax=Candidatus Nealsonbacteria bacterium CG08_land_8_20_14_0_20_43_11 TaxID=1974706 RepID=A0A2M6T0K2_9BACT|nr:MAG: hypothetical protein COT34_01635 [Candidatus Nealsonbacteria bacterium CG08_land_8_20_14_0_20_43_11]